MNSLPKTLWIKKQFLKQILNGRKTVEVRVGYKKILKFKPGMILLLNNKYKTKIKDIRCYKSFKKMAEVENPDRIVPGMSKNKITNLFKSLYPASKEKLGVFAIELELFQK